MSEINQYFDGATNDIAFSSILFERCESWNYGIGSLRACAALHKDSKERYSVRVSLQGREIFNKSFKISDPKIEACRSTDGIPILEPISREVCVKVKNVKVTSKRFKCDIVLTVTFDWVVVGEKSFTFPVDVAIKTFSLIRATSTTVVEYFEEATSEDPEE